MEDNQSTTTSQSASATSTNGRRRGTRQQQRNINLKQQQDLTDSAMEILLNPTLTSPTRLSSSGSVTSTSPFHPSKLAFVTDDNDKHLPSLKEKEEQQLIDDVSSTNEEAEPKNAIKTTTLAPVASPLISPNTSNKNHHHKMKIDNGSHRMLVFGEEGGGTANEPGTAMDFVVEEEEDEKSDNKLLKMNSEHQVDIFNLMGANLASSSTESSPPISSPEQQHVEKSKTTTATPASGDSKVTATSTTNTKSKTKKKLSSSSSSSSSKKESASASPTSDTTRVGDRTSPVAVISGGGGGAMDEVEIRDNFWGIPVANKSSSAAAVVVSNPSTSGDVDHSPPEGGDLMTFVVEEEEEAMMDQAAKKKSNSSAASSSSSSSTPPAFVEPQTTTSQKQKKKKKTNVVPSASDTATAAITVSAAPSPQSTPQIASSSSNNNNNKIDKEKSAKQEEQPVVRSESKAVSRVVEEEAAKKKPGTTATNQDEKQQLHHTDRSNVVKSSATSSSVTTAKPSQQNGAVGHGSKEQVVNVSQHDQQQVTSKEHEEEEEEKTTDETEREKQRLRRVEREWAFKHNLPADLANLVLTVREFKTFGGTNLALLDSGGHIRFKITRSLLNDLDDLSPQHVFRRFRDFQALFLRLAHLFPFEIVPALPSTLFPSFSDDFLQIRSRRLEAFLYTLLRRNKRFWQCEDVQNFLLKESEVFDEMAVRYLGNNGQDLSVPPSLVSEKFFSFVKKIAASTATTTSSSSTSTASTSPGHDLKRKYDEQRGEISASYEALSVFIDGQGGKQDRLDCWETLIDKLEQINSLTQSRMGVLMKMKSTLSEVFPEEPNIAEAFDFSQDDLFTIQLTGADKSPSIGNKSMQGCLRSAHQSATLLGGAKETMTRVMLEENFAKLGENGLKEMVDKLAKLKRETSQLSLEMAREFAQASLVKAESTRKSMEALKASLESAL